MGWSGAGPALSGCGSGLSGWLVLSGWPVVAGGESGAVGGGDGEEAAGAGAVVVVGVEGHVPSGAVDDAVVVAAQQREVVDGGRAAVGVAGDVVGVAPRRGSVTSGEDAVSVADGERSALLGVGVAFVASAGDGLAVRGDEDPGVGGVAGEHLPLAARVPESGAGEVHRPLRPVDGAVVTRSGQEGAVVEQVGDGVGVDVDDERDVRRGTGARAGVGRASTAFDEVDERSGQQLRAGRHLE